MGDNVLTGLIGLLEKKYNLKVLASHYILVDEKFAKYNTMLEVRLNQQMAANFAKLYGNKTSAMHVAWSIVDDRIRFYAAIGNNILLLLDSLLTDGKAGEATLN